MILSGTVLVKAEPASQIKFQAEKRVRVLTRENIKKIDYIEFISRIYGYTGYESLKKDYWSAKMEVVRGDVVKAREILEKNRDDLNRYMSEVFSKYRDRSNIVINDGVMKISEMHIQAMDSKEEKTRKLYKQNNDRMNVAMEHVRLAEKAGMKENYREAIKHYRNAKFIAIEVIKKLSAGTHADDILSKYELDIKDLNTEYIKKDSY